MEILRRGGGLLFGAVCLPILFTAARKRGTQGNSRRRERRLQDFANRGHDIESHSVTHPHLRDLSPAQLNAELTQSQATLRQLFGPNAATDFASPYAEYNDAVVAAIK
ncbi:MAG: polysaccharide deacetylase family protein [Pseudarthrobacter sp.]